VAGGRAKASLVAGGRNVDNISTFPSGRPMDESPELRLLFHRLNNQLGIILANAELLEAKAADDIHRARAGQVVASALEAMGTAKEIRRCTMVTPEPQ
jgi:hypothetical protein